MALCLYTLPFLLIYCILHDRILIGARMGGVRFLKDLEILAP